MGVSAPLGRLCLSQKSGFRIQCLEEAIGHRSAAWEQRTAYPRKAMTMLWANPFNPTRFWCTRKRFMNLQRSNLSAARVIFHSCISYAKTEGSELVSVARILASIPTSSMPFIFYIDSAMFSMLSLLGNPFPTPLETKNIKDKRVLLCVIGVLLIYGAELTDRKSTVSLLILRDAARFAKPSSPYVSA